LGKFTEGPLGLAHALQDPSLDHDFAWLGTRTEFVRHLTTSTGAPSSAPAIAIVVLVQRGDRLRRPITVPDVRR